MKSLKKYCLKLCKILIKISLVSFLAIYIYSFIWFKLGLSLSPSFMGYMPINSQVDSKLLSINEGDFILVKEHQYNNIAEENDIILFTNKDSSQAVGLINGIIIDEKLNKNYIVFDDTLENKTQISSKDVIGEILFVSDNTGAIVEFALSPYGIIVIILVIFALYKVREFSILRRNVEHNTEDGLEDSNKCTVEPLVIEDVVVHGPSTQNKKIKKEKNVSEDTSISNDAQSSVTKQSKQYSNGKSKNKKKKKRKKKNSGKKRTNKKKK